MKLLTNDAAHGISARLSQREREVLKACALAVVPAFLQWGLAGVLAVASLASWLLPGYLEMVERAPTGRLAHDLWLIAAETLYAYPLFTWYVINGDLVRGSIIVPLAACLTLCYYIAWYGKWSRLRNEQARRSMVALTWALCFALVL